MLDKDLNETRSDADTDSSMRDYVRRALRRQRNSALVGFAVLLIGIGGAVTANNYETCQSRQANVNQINSTIGGILQRLDTANQLQFEKGNVTIAEREMARDFYQGELKQLPIAVKCNYL